MAKKKTEDKVTDVPVFYPKHKIKKPTPNRDEYGFRLQKFDHNNKFEPMETNDLKALLDMSIKSLQRSARGLAPIYTNDQAGFERFRQETVNYFMYIQSVNDTIDEDEDKIGIIPDMESWAVYLGTTRKTILNYEKVRGDVWQKFIHEAKNAIASTQKQLMMRNKISSLVGIFNFCNNYGYSNTSEFKLETNIAVVETKELNIEDIKSRYIADYHDDDVIDVTPTND